MKHRDAEGWELMDVIGHRSEFPNRMDQEQPTGRPVTMPCPPGLDPDKWVILGRKTRRALWRYHRKLNK